MAVNLNGIDLSCAGAGSARKEPAPQGTAASPQDAARQPQSEVSITSTASLLAHLRQSLAAQPAVDQHRVDSVGRALAAGTYEVHPDKIAHGLIQLEHALGALK